MASDTTAPVPARLSFEAYCEALGIDANDTRDASLVRALHARLEHTSDLMRAPIVALDSIMFESDH